MACVLVAAACGGEDGGPGPGAAEAVVDTVEGAVRTTWSAERAEPLGWSADTVAVIGDAMADDPYQFAEPEAAGVAGTPEGGVLVADRQGSRVLEYGPDGRHAATWGRPGEGPGELRHPAGIDLGPGDTVWVSDLGARRLTGFPRGGGAPRTVPFPEGDGFPGSRIAAFAGGFLQVRGTIGPPGQAIPEPLIRLDRRLGPLDTLWLPPTEPMDVVEIELGGMARVMGIPREFWPRFRWRALPGGRAVVSDEADYVVRIVAPDGRVERIVRRDPPARAATDSDREAARRRVLAEAPVGDGPEATLERRTAEARVERMTFAEWIPRIVALAVDPTDRIWVGVSEEAPGEVERIDLYDAAGRLLGELRDVPMPVAFTGRDRILLLRTDALDVPQVVVLRVRGMDARPSAP